MGIWASIDLGHDILFNINNCKVGCAKLLWVDYRDTLEWEINTTHDTSMHTNICLHSTNKLREVRTVEKVQLFREKESLCDRQPPLECKIRPKRCSIQVGWAKFNNERGATSIYRTFSHEQSPFAKWYLSRCCSTKHLLQSEWFIVGKLGHCKLKDIAMC